MRVRLFLLFALLCATPAWAHDQPTAPDPTTPAPRVRMTSEQRFQAANTTRDGKLTRDQAKEGYKSIARNFDAIDATGKGFVTLDDIRAWRKAVREARQAERKAMEDPLRPRQAVQLRPAGQPPTVPDAVTPGGKGGSGPDIQADDDGR